MVLEPSPKSIKELLLTAPNASDILTSQNIPHATIQSIDLSDQPAVVIHYLQGRERKTIEVSLTTFLVPFWTLRQYRSRSYVAIPKSETEIEVQNTADSRPPQTVRRTGNYLMCTCEDFRNQTNAFQPHFSLWQLIKRQPRCKHVFCAAAHFGIGEEQFAIQQAL